MSLNCANWSDRQLDELADLLRTSDLSLVASFISRNFLCSDTSGGRIITDPSGTTLRLTVGTDTKTVSLSQGVFLYDGFVSQVDSAQIINILNTASGSWGTGKIADAQPRWDIVSVKWNHQLNTSALRWFVDDTVTPNTYTQQSVNTLDNKAYYDIRVDHGTPGGNPVVPETPTGYFTIGEIYIPAGANSIIQENIFDTTGISNASSPNWTTSTRVLRMEFWSTMFTTDHDPDTGYHRDGGWHIGNIPILVTGEELNRALDGIGATVTAANLTSLTDTSVLPDGTLHSHGGSGTPKKYILIQDEKAAGVEGGSFVKDAWRTRTLNIIKTDDTGVVVLASNQITLPVGTYTCFISAPSRNVDENKARLRNITDGTTTLVGTAEDTSAGGVTSRSIIQGKFTIAGAKIFEVQHWCSSTANTHGFGHCIDSGPPNGEVEIYTVAQFWKC
jgi:hypothetical protein